MSISKLVPARMSNNESDLLIAFNPGSKFNCKRCKETVRDLVSLCRKCKGYMHPSCAGVKTETVHCTDGTKRVVLPGSEKLPKSCRDCLRKKETVRGKQLCLQQRSKLATNQQHSTTYDVIRRSTAPPAVGNNSITRFLELGTGPPHKLEEGHDDCMVHRHKPGHELRPKDNGTSYLCSGCKMKGFGLHYSCVNASCSFCLHTECEAPRKLKRHRFFPDLTFAFSGLHNTSDRSIFCKACGMNVNGYNFHSLDGKNNLHPCCMNLPKKIICGDSGAEMKLRPQTTSKCGYCHKRSMKVGNKSSDHVWSYKAVTDTYHLHIRCMIKMFSDMREDSMGCLISSKMISKGHEAKIVLRRAMTTCQTKFKIFKKYAKFLVGAIITAFLGDPTMLFVHTAKEFISMG